MLLKGGVVAEWVRALALNGDRTFPAGFDSHCGRLWVRNIGNSVNPSLPVSFGWDTKSRWSLLSGVYARGSKRSHQSALECVTVVDSTSHSKSPSVRQCGARRCPAQYQKKKKKMTSYRAAKLSLLNFLSLFRDLQKPTRFSGGGGSSRILGGSSRNFQWSPQAKSNFYPTLSGDIHG